MSERKIPAEDALHGQVVHHQPGHTELQRIDLQVARVLAADVHAAGVATDQAGACIRAHLSALSRRQASRINQAKGRAGVDVHIHRHAFDLERADQMKAARGGAGRHDSHVGRQKANRQNSGAGSNVGVHEPRQVAHRQNSGAGSNFGNHEPR